jgi:hypothetical protein
MSIFSPELAFGPSPCSARESAGKNSKEAVHVAATDNNASYKDGVEWSRADLFEAIAST